MSQIHVAMPPLEVPPNTREGSLSREELLRLSLWLSLSSIAFGVFCALICILSSIIFLYGDHAVLYIEASEYVIISISCCLFYALIVFSNIYYSFREINTRGSSILNGFTEEYLYGATPFSQAVDRWEYYSCWKENKGYFLLKRGHWHIIPKSMWTESELAELRGIMKKKIGRHP